MKIKAYSIDNFSSGLVDISVYEDILHEFTNGTEQVIIELSDNVVDLYIELNLENLMFLMDIMIEHERYENASQLKTMIDEMQ